MILLPNLFSAEKYLHFIVVRIYMKFAWQLLHLFIKMYGDFPVTKFVIRKGGMGNKISKEKTCIICTEKNHM